jgi:hypothetical protein
MSKTLKPTPRHPVAENDPSRQAAELDRKRSQLIEENTRLQRALHLLLAIWPVGTDASLWEQ